MKICVMGLWHLGSVTAAGCAKFFDVVGLDCDPDLISKLQVGRAPISEPGLDALLGEGIAAQRLSFTTEVEAAREADVLWVCFDTAVDQNDVADVEAVLREVRRVVPHLKPQTPVVLSSQLPAGTCRALENELPGTSFSCAPENLRLGNALEVFLRPERIVIGVRDAATRAQLEPLFSRFCDNLIWMAPESAELTKHSINAFLALSVTFMNEIAALCEAMGADAKEVEVGLKSDARIGKRAYLSPGEAFAGGTLARDVVTMTQLAAQNQIALELVSAIQTSNNRHKEWALTKLKREIGDLSGVTVAVLGLTYKPGTDTLRRSSAVELCRALLRAGAKVRAFDPMIATWPSEMQEELSAIELAPSAENAFQNARAGVICTPWPEFKNLNWLLALSRMETPLLLDANRFVAPLVVAVPNLKLRTVGLGR